MPMPPCKHRPGRELEEPTQFRVGPTEPGAECEAGPRERDHRYSDEPDHPEHSAHREHEPFGTSEGQCWVRAREHPKDDE